jgi:leucyl/phenylalanyl-tRNA--protein transferase
LSQLSIHWLSATDPPEAFPPIDQALREPNGLLAAGGDLSASRLLYAYRAGIFPWFESSQPILWWSPDPRCLLRPDRFHVSRRLRRHARSAGFELTFNQACGDVIEACSVRRPGQSGTWITSEMKRAYLALHAAGWVHSVEVWLGTRLVGGVYGLASGTAFFGESMFSLESNASKIALLALCRVLDDRGYVLLDCQVASPHLLTLGAELVSRSDFSKLLAVVNRSTHPAEAWPRGRIPAAEILRSQGVIALQ